MVARRGRILVVDDDPEIIRLLSTRLSDDGYEVTASCEGVACMAQLRRADPDVVVLDLGIPAGRGYLTLERLRDNPHWANLPVVALVPSREAEARERALRAGATESCEKTTDAQEFLEMISRLLEKDCSHSA